MITFQEETLNQIHDKEFEDMLKLHSKELTEFSFKLNPDWKVYQQLEDINALHIVTARGDEKLVGYYVSIITTHHHYKDALVAENDLHYILPEYRRGWLGYKFLKEVIQFLKRRNVGIIMHSMKVSHSYLPLTERLGFRLMEYKVVMEV